VECVLGGIEQNAPGAWDGEAAQTRRAGGDRDGEVEGKERFAAFWLAADDSDRLFRLQGGDEPALLLGAFGETISGLERQQAHRRRPAAAFSGASCA
jgi:hypothetical protein